MTNEQLQAPAGGHFHQLSEKFYDGGQFMPEPDCLAGSKRKAAKKAERYHYNGVKASGCTVFVSQCVRFVPSEYEPRWITRQRAVFTGKNEAEANLVAASIPQFGRVAA